MSVECEVEKSRKKFSLIVSMQLTYCPDHLETIKWVYNAIWTCVFLIVQYLNSIFAWRVDKVFHFLWRRCLPALLFTPFNAGSVCGQVSSDNFKDAHRTLWFSVCAFQVTQCYNSWVFVCVYVRTRLFMRQIIIT